MTEEVVGKDSVFKAEPGGRSAPSVARVYRPTPGEMRALNALAAGSLGYWQWRAACVTYDRPHNQRFRRAWSQKLTQLGLIEIDREQAVKLTALGRAAISPPTGRVPDRTTLNTDPETSETP